MKDVLVVGGGIVGVAIASACASPEMVTLGNDSARSVA